MAFVTPQSVTDFFAAKPLAKDVFVDETYENIYLNNFQAKALETAKKNTKRLYRVKANTTVNRIYPAGFLYKLIHDANDYNVTNALINEETASIAAQTAVAIGEAFDAALGAAAILATPTQVIEISESVYEIRILTNVDDIEVGILDENEDENFNYTQEFL